MHVLCPRETIIIDGITFFIATSAKGWYEHLLHTVGRDIKMKQTDNGQCRVSWHSFQQLNNQQREEAVYVLVAVNILSTKKEGNCEIVNPNGDSLMPTLNGMYTFFHAHDRANLRMYCSSLPNIPHYHLFRVRVWDMDGEHYVDTA